MHTIMLHTFQAFRLATQVLSTNQSAQKQHIINLHGNFSSYAASVSCSSHSNGSPVLLGPPVLFVASVNAAKLPKFTSGYVLRL